MSRKKSIYDKDNEKSGLWFISEPGHVESLAEICRTGYADEIDVDRIYYLGRTCQALLISNRKLKEKLNSEREFTKSLKDSVSRFNETLERNNGEFTEEVGIEAGYLIEVIMDHMTEKSYRSKKPNIFQLLIDKFEEVLSKF